MTNLHKKNGVAAVLVAFLVGVAILAPSKAHAGSYNVWVANLYSDSISVYDDLGTHLESITDSLIDGPLGMTTGPDGAIYLSSAYTHSVVRIDADTHAVSNLVTTNLNYPYDVLFDTSGRILVANYNSKNVQRFNSDGSFDQTLIQYSAEWPLVEYPCSLSYGPDKNGDGKSDLYVGLNAVYSTSYKARVAVHDADTGAEIETFFSTNIANDQLTSIAVPDYTGDGVNEVVIGQWGVGDDGSVGLHDGSTGDLLSSLSGTINGVTIDNVQGVAFDANKDILYFVNSGNNQMHLADVSGSGFSRHGVFTMSNLSMPMGVLLLPNDPTTCQEVVEYGYGLSADLNEDCYVEWADFGIFASQWQQCSDPGDASCNQNW